MPAGSRAARRRRCRRCWTRAQCPSGWSRPTSLRWSGPSRRRRLSCGSQPVEPGPHHRRIVVRLGRRGRRRTGADRPRHRHRRVGPQPGRLLRHRRDEAHLRRRLPRRRAAARALARPSRLSGALRVRRGDPSCGPDRRRAAGAGTAPRRDPRRLRPRLGPRSRDDAGRSGPAGRGRVGPVADRRGGGAGPPARHRHAGGRRRGHPPRRGAGDLRLDRRGRWRPDRPDGLSEPDCRLRADGAGRRARPIGRPSTRGPRSMPSSPPAM